MDIQTLWTAASALTMQGVGYLVWAMGACSVADAVLPQPAPGSRWLPLRKLISVVAFNVAHATNGGQQSFADWLELRAQTRAQQLQAQLAPLVQLMVAAAVPAAPAAATAPPAPQADSGSIAKPTLTATAGATATTGAMLLFALFGLGGLTACATTPTQAEIEVGALAAYRAVLETTVTVMKSPGLSDRAVADLRAIDSVTTPAVLAALDDAQNGGASAIANAAAALPAAVSAVQAALHATHGGTTIDPKLIEQAAIGPGITAGTTIALVATGSPPDIAGIVAAIKAAHVAINPPNQVAAPAQTVDVETRS